RCLAWTNFRCGRGAILWNCGARRGTPTPFADKRVRQAMSHLLDRESMIRDLWKGVGEATEQYFLPGTIGYDPELKPRAFDRERARTLLREAGWEPRDRSGVLKDGSGAELAFELTYWGGGQIAEQTVAFIKAACAA